MASLNDVFDVKTHSIRCQHIREYPQALLDEDRHPVFEAKQYIPRSNRASEPGDLTIIFAGALAYPKECYEPFILSVFQAYQKQGCHVRGIWLADPSYQGASALLNAEVNGNEPSWLDHSRDLLLMVNDFRVDIVPPIVGLGHSMGASQLLQLSLLHPALFTSLILIEPAVYDNSSRIGSMGSLKSIALKQDRWPTLEEASAAVRKSPLFRRWDPQVVDNFIKYGLQKTESDVRLGVTKEMELAIFTRPNIDGVGLKANGGLKAMTREQRRHHPDVDPRARYLQPYYVPATRSINRLLPHVRPRALWIDAARGQAIDINNFCEARFRACGAGVGGSGGAAAGQVSRVVVDKAGHFMPMEAEHRLRLAAIVATRLAVEVAVWREDRAEERARGWWTLPREQRQRYDARVLGAFQQWDGSKYIDEAELATVGGVSGWSRDSKL